MKLLCAFSSRVLSLGILWYAVTGRVQNSYGIYLYCTRGDEKICPYVFQTEKKSQKMSIKNQYLPAQSGKISMEIGVYCGLNGVKSMIVVI